ncbi:AEC family transporter [Puniceicoccales bacterium CK1056]|uniref:AEC family transporter n=1 Tax=Oceanipulchritudo coccoides TaxID=2706888 RepID=A0A6B2M5F3_9BACT|nr:AEC family transporter [Oceanipulchritudo coccoides]NDV63452.1 AEC family transporter [Oceanipulchritudo coccoides]
MGYIISTLFPVFAVLGLGYILARKTFLSRDFLNELNRFVYYISLPALIINGLATAQSLPSGTVPTFLIYMAATFLVIGAAFLTARLLKLQRWQFGTFIQASFRGNLAFIGIPVLVYALRDYPKEFAAGIVAQAIFVFAPTMIFYNVVSVLLLIGSRDGDASDRMRGMLKSIATNPLILASVGGVILFLLPFSLPEPVYNTLEFVGRIAAPAALICVGGGMAVVSMEGRYRSATFSAILKTAVTPLFAWVMSLPFNLSSETTLLLMIFAATPTAVASYVMAKELDGDEAMASGGIVLSTVFSIISLSIVVGLF